MEEDVQNLLTIIESEPDLDVLRQNIDFNGYYTSQKENKKIIKCQQM